MELEWSSNGALSFATVFSLGVGIGVAAGFLIAKKRIPNGAGIPPVSCASVLGKCSLNPSCPLSLG